LTAYLVVTGARLVVASPAPDAAVLAPHAGLLGLALAVLFLPSAPRWLREWLPIIALPILYSEIPALIAAHGHVATNDAVVLRWEHMVFGGDPSRAWAAKWAWLPMSEVLHASYLSYYAIVFSVPAALAFTGRRNELGVATFVLLLTFITCFLLYSVFPVDGPRYGSVTPIPGMMRAAVLWVLENGSSRGTAFPSSHVAVATTQSILAVWYFGRRGVAVGALTVALAAGAVYGGFHYAVDAVAGVALGVGISAVGLGLMGATRRKPSDQANATAPT